MKVGINIDRSVEEIEVLITAHEQSRTVNALYEHIVEFDKKSLETLTAYKDDIVLSSTLGAPDLSYIRQIK